MVRGIKATKRTILFLVPMIILTTLINPLLDHKGITILTYLPSGNPLTLEALIYGLCASVMIINVIFWFEYYKEIMTSDKFIYLFGKIIPSMSLKDDVVLHILS